MSSREMVFKLTKVQLKAGGTQIIAAVAVANTTSEAHFVAVGTPGTILRTSQGDASTDWSV